MNRLKAIALLGFLLPALCLAQKKKHNDVPAVFETAHSVYVEAENGDLSKPGVSPADRQAIANVQDALHQWNRYELAVHAEQADLVIVVRKRLPANPNDQTGLNNGPRSPSVQNPIRAPGQGGDAGGLGAPGQAAPEEDRLRIYTVGPNGKLVGPIWTRELPGGLDSPGLVILQQLKLAVERAYPSAAPAEKPTQ
jgi:hypothetical protein